MELFTLRYFLGHQLRLKIIANIHTQRSKSSWQFFSETPKEMLGHKLNYHNFTIPVIFQSLEYLERDSPLSPRIPTFVNKLIAAEIYSQHIPNSNIISGFSCHILTIFLELDLTLLYLCEIVVLIILDYSILNWVQRHKESGNHFISTWCQWREAWRYVPYSFLQLHNCLKWEGCLVPANI